jgi:hypothetical protein
MSANHWLALCALVALQGCPAITDSSFTKRLWEERWDEARYQWLANPAPEAILEAARLPDGSHYLALRMSDGVDYGFVTDTPERVAVRRASAARASHPLPIMEGALQPCRLGAVPADPPPGVVRLRIASPLPAEQDAQADAPAVQIEGTSIVLTDRDGQIEVLGYTPWKPRSAPAPRGRAARVAETSGRVLITPIMLALDATVVVLFPVLWPLFLPRC